MRGENAGWSRKGGGRGREERRKIAETKEIEGEPTLYP